jgi:TrmH family RNA methyltransferase
MKDGDDSFSMKHHPPNAPQPFQIQPSGLSRSQHKTLRSLKEKKGRQEQGRFLIEGVHLCAEALQFGQKPVLLLYTQSGFENRKVKATVVKAQHMGVPNLRVGQSTLNSLSDAVTPQGIMAVMEKPPPAAVPGPGNIFVLLDQVRDPGNVGTIIRTADAAGVDGVYISTEAADLYNPKVLRATQGSVFHIPIWPEVESASCLKALRNEGVRVFIAEPRAGRLHTEVRYPGRFVLVVGNEIQGVRREIRDRADGLIRVPIRGEAESLNVAIACGVILYESLRQRMKKKMPQSARRRR